MTKLLFLAALLFAGNAFGQALELPRWSYEGETGPENWGELNGAYELCSVGTQQSPIDLSTSTASQEALPDIVFNYQPSVLTLLNNGETIQVIYDDGSYIELDGNRFDLLQFHFHLPSEHSVDGELADAELHFVHRSPEGQGVLAVVGVLINVGEENQALAEVVANAPEEEGEPERVLEFIEASAILPENRLTYRYAGSLTTPPCSQGVRWNVLAEPITVSQEQLDRLLSITGESNRPLQPLGDRVLLEDSSED